MPQKPPIVVTEPEYRKAEDIFSNAGSFDCRSAPPGEQDLASAIQDSGAHYAIVGVAPYRDKLYTSLPRGGVLARFGVGHENIDKATATSAGVLCTNTPRVLDQCVAEHTLFLIGAAARHLVSHASAMAHSTWAQQVGSVLAGKTLTIIGLGHIGRAVARMASAGFGMRVIGCTHSPVPRDIRELGIEKAFDDFSAAVKGADYVSLHIPATPANAHFMNRERLALLQGAWLINTARGSIVDEVALFNALAAKRLAGAALDVFEREPYEPADPQCDLRKLDNVVLTPHIASDTVEGNRRIAERTLHNITLAQAARYAEMDLLNPEVLEELS